MRHSLLWLSRVIAGALVLRKSTLWIIPYPIVMPQRWICNRVYAFLRGPRAFTWVVQYPALMAVMVSSPRLVYPSAAKISDM